MTTRINFGLLRAGGGANNNPETLQVAQIFRLLSLYSLVKPPKGSNVTGGNLLDALVRQEDDTVSYNTTKKQLTKVEMDLQLDQALTRDVGNGAAMRFADNEEAFAYVCGFIARTQTKRLFFVLQVNHW
jgi:hypothetical protein